MNKIRIISVFSILLFLAFALPSAGQKKSPHSNVKEQVKNGKEDPWADYKEEKDSVSRWAYGINFGGYFANKYSANYYNGTPGNIDTVSYLFTNKDLSNEIKALLGISATGKIVIPDYPKSLKSFPLDMHYNVAITVGVFLRYNFNRKNGLFLQANYVQLKAENVLKIEVNPPSYNTDQHDYRKLPISGKEERAMLDLGYQHSFLLKSKIYFFLNGGVTMVYTHVKKHVLVIQGKEYNLINVYGVKGYSLNAQEFTANQYGIGFGGLVGGGVGLPLTDMFGLEPGVAMQYNPVNLTGYTAWKPNFSIYIRILLGFSHSKVT